MAFAKFQECYFKPLTPNCEQNYSVDRNEERSAATPKTKYPMFSNFFVRLASFDHSPLHSNPQDFAQQGFFYKWLGDIVCCYECGFVLSHLREDDEPLLKHRLYLPACRHLAMIADQTSLQDCKAQLQRLDANGSREREIEPGEKETMSSKYEEANKRPTEYASYEVRLSTFTRFPRISELNIKVMAAAGFYYKGLGDNVWCYACGNGLKKWQPGEEPWEEHYKWFPDCPHLKQYSYKPRRTAGKPDESSGNADKELSTPGKHIQLFYSEHSVRKSDEKTTEKQRKVMQNAPSNGSAEVMSVKKVENKNKIPRRSSEKFDICY